MSIWKTIQESLEQNGFPTYPPGLKVGECKEPYIVVRQSGGNQLNNYSSETIYFDFMLYVPKNMYSELDEFEKDVKNVLDTDLYPTIMPTGSTNPDFYDDEVKAHMRSFMYRNTRRNKHL